MAPFAVLYLFICVYVAFKGYFGACGYLFPCTHSAQCDQTYIRVLISNYMQIREL